MGSATKVNIPAPDAPYIRQDSASNAQRLNVVFHQLSHGGQSPKSQGKASTTGLEGTNRYMERMQVDGSSLLANGFLLNSYLWLRAWQRQSQMAMSEMTTFTSGHMLQARRHH